MLTQHQDSSGGLSVSALCFYAGNLRTDHLQMGQGFRVRPVPARAFFTRSDAKDAVFMPKHPTDPDDNTDTQDYQEQQDSQGHTKRGLAPSIWTLDFDDFVGYAADQEPDKDDFSDGWHSPLWGFTRLIRGYFNHDVKSSAAWRDVNKAVRRRLEGGWGYFGLSVEEAHFEFVQAWKKIRLRPDEDPLGQALHKAEKFPIQAPKQDGEQRPTPGYDRFCSLVLWLQFGRKGETIYLPVREVARVLKTDQRMISLWRQQAIDDGFLVVITVHQYKPGHKGKATEFKVGDGFMEWFEKHMDGRVK